MSDKQKHWALAIDFEACGSNPRLHRTIALGMSVVDENFNCIASRMVVHGTKPEVPTSKESKPKVPEDGSVPEGFD